MRLTGSPTGSAVRRAIIWYVVWSLIVLVLISLGVVLYGERLARTEALRDAERHAEAVATGLVAPLADEGFHARDPRALAALTQAMDLRSRDGSIAHIKIWGDAGDGSGQILWATQKPLVGQTFQMDPEEYELFGTTEVVSEVSDLHKDENSLERDAGHLVEVYAGLRDAAGEDLLFEAYMTTTAMEQDTRALAVEILPLPLTALLLFAVATLPVAASLARRVDMADSQMRRLLVNAVESSDLERRRIAQDLHDGVLQDIAGAGYALSSDARHLPEGSDLRGHMSEVSSLLTSDVAALRHLMADIYPPDLESRGLSQSLHDLVLTQEFGDAQVTTQIAVDLAPSPLAARLAYRVTREVLRNVAKHAHATNIAVRMHQSGTSLILEIADDGVGFSPTTDGPEGHFGLRLVQETVVDAGGSMTIDSTPGAGTTVRAELPT